MSTKFRCSRCGQEFEIRETATIGLKPQKWQEFAFDAGPSLPPGMTYHKRESARVPVREDVLVPLAWAVITGIALTGVVTVITILLDWPWHWPFVALFGGAGVMWMLLLADWRNMLWRVEEITGIDLDKDNTKGGLHPHVVEWTDHTKKRKVWAELPVDEKVMARVAQAYLGGKFEFSRRDMVAATCISDGNFEKLQKLFLQKGWAVYKKEDAPNVGVELTAAGRHLLSTYL